MEAYHVEAEHIYAVTLSSHLSGSYNSAVLGKNLYLEKYGNKKIHIVDSESASGGECQIALKLMELEEQGFSNVCVMPNCKELTVLSESELVFPELEPYKLCTFSRVMREKGIEEAVEAVKTVNDALGRQVFSLDIYGQIDSAQTDWFTQLQKRFPAFVRYGGMVPFDKSVEVLKEYFALLFPTCYEGEGFAGTLIDAFSAGVPVVASDWKYNAEIVNEQVGFVYPTGNQDAFVDVLMQIANNPQLILDKKYPCLKEAEKYRIDRALRILIDQIEGE